RRRALLSFAEINTGTPPVGRALTHRRASRPNRSPDFARMGHHRPHPLDPERTADLTNYMTRFFLLVVIMGASTIVHAQTVKTRSAHFSVVHPRTMDARDTGYVLDLLEHNRADLLARVSNAGIDTHLANLDLIFNASTGDFVARTGMPSWAAAATDKNKIELQPLPLLKQRRILESTLRHELAHAVIDTLGNSPRWLAEGMAIYLAGEGKLLDPYRSDTPTST